MATTKRKKGGRAAATRDRGRAVKKSAPKKPAQRASSAKAGKAKAAKPKIVAKGKIAPKAIAKPRRQAAVPTRVAARPAVGKTVVESPEIAALKSKFQRERNGFEKRLTEAVREIGMLRHHELRAMQLERQLAERDATILQLQQRIALTDRHPAGEPVVYVHEVQQSLALGMSVSAGVEDVGAELETAALDEFEEQQLVDDTDLVADEDPDEDSAGDDGDVLSDD